MSIPINEYVDIVSGVGAAAAVSERELIGRLFISNDLLPTGTERDFTAADDVGAYFGFTSDEYKRAVFYFGWISKSITADEKISFSRWADADTAPMIFGAKGAQSIAAWNAISAGAFTLEMGGTSHLLAAMDFSAAANLAAVAAIIQAKIRTQATTMWTAATVVWDATRASFNLVGGDTGAATISVTAGSGGSDIAAQLGWLAASAIFSDGADIQTITEVLSSSAERSDNFGSFTFVDTLTQNQIVEAAEWNLTHNNEFMYSVRCTSSNAAALSTALVDIGGVTLTLAPLATEYPEQVPMMILAATNYASRNSTKNYMFQMFNLTPSVTTKADYDTYKAIRVNFYGQTQTAGALVNFYQEGVMQGLPVDPRDQNTYANEIWLKTASTAAIMTLLLALEKISANTTGQAQVTAILQGVINQALFNGTISPGKRLSQTQKLYITQQTGDENAWKQVENIGYWVTVQIVPYVEDAVTKYKVVYTLIYSKDDVIRKVEGTDILI